jgi:hypothetical protein
VTGQAKRKKRAFDDLLRKYPWCIYCGGVVAADSIEHNPAKVIFIGKQRPKGLEFPCCRPCNEGTSRADLMAGLISRAGYEPKNDAEKSEIMKLWRAASNNFPGLLQEMKMGRAAEKLLLKSIPGISASAGALRTGPIVSKNMCTFGAKLGFALHYEAFGTAVPLSGGVQPMWFSNVQAAKGELPSDLINLLPPAKTLRQGTKHVSDQFEYSWIPTEEKRHTFFYAVFRSSFAVGAVSALDRSEFLMKNADKFPVFAPGDFAKM